MLLFQSTTIYGESWKAIDQRGLCKEELEMFIRAEITEGDYGPAVKFTVKTGGCCYFGVGKDTIERGQFTIGDDLTEHLNDLIVTTIQKGNVTKHKIDWMFE